MCQYLISVVIYFLDFHYCVMYSFVESRAFKIMAVVLLF